MSIGSVSVRDAVIEAGSLEAASHTGRRRLHVVGAGACLKSCVVEHTVDIGEGCVIDEGPSSEHSS